MHQNGHPMLDFKITNFMPKKDIKGPIECQKLVLKGDVFTCLLLEDQSDNACIFGELKWMFILVDLLVCEPIFSRNPPL